MTDDRVRRLEEPRLVEVLHDDDVWREGWLEGWIRHEDGWRGSVEYVVAPGEKYVRVVPEARVRPVRRRPGRSP